MRRAPVHVMTWVVAWLVFASLACGTGSRRGSMPLGALAPWAMHILEAPTEIERIIFETRAIVTFDPIASVRGHDIVARVPVAVTTWSTSVFDQGWRGVPSFPENSPVADRAIRVRRGEAELLIIGNHSGEFVEIDGGLDRIVLVVTPVEFRSWWASAEWR